MIVPRLKIEAHVRRDSPGDRLVKGTRIVVDRFAMKFGFLLVHIVEPKKCWLFEQDTDLYRYSKDDRRIDPGYMDAAVRYHGKLEEAKHEGV